MKKIISTTIFCALLLSSLGAVPAIAAPDATVTAGFDVWGPPVIEVNNPDADMTVLETQTVTISVTMQGAGLTLADLTLLTFVAYYDVDAGSDLGEFNDQLFNPQTAVKITWTEAGGFVLEAGGSTSWTLGVCLAPDLGLSSGVFVFQFSPGVVAMATTGFDKWQFAASADMPSDEGTLTGYNYDPEGASMQFYAELSAVPSSINWGKISAGMGYSNSSPSMEIMGTVTIIANGQHRLQVKSSDSTWGGSSLLQESGIPSGPNEFSILFGRNSDYEGGGVVPLETVNKTVLTNFITPEAGLTSASIKMWLSTHSIFDPNVYSGTIILTTLPYFTE